MQRGKNVQLFAFKNKNPRNTIPYWAPIKHTLNGGFARAYFKWAWFFFSSNFDRITCRKWQAISQTGSLILLLQLFQHFCHDRQWSFPLQPSLPSFFQILFCFINLINNLSITQDFITTMNSGLFLALTGTKPSFLLLSTTSWKT